MIWPLSLIERWRVMLADRKFPPPDDDVISVVEQITNTDLDWRNVLRRKALEVAIGEIGKGEIGGNNLGPHVAKYLSPSKPPLPWCAGFAGFCYEQAARELGVTLPFRRSLSARKLAANIAAVGRKFTDPSEARPGDVMLFARGPSGSSLGHVALVVDADTVAPRATILCIEGNHSPHVARFFRHPTRDRFLYFASLRKYP